MADARELDIIMPLNMSINGQELSKANARELIKLLFLWDRLLYVFGYPSVTSDDIEYYHWE